MTSVQMKREELVRSVVRYAHVDRMSVAEIAERMELDEKQVREFNESAFAEAIRGYVYCCVKKPRRPRLIGRDMEQQGFSSTAIRRTLGVHIERDIPPAPPARRPVERTPLEVRLKRVVELYDEGFSATAACAMARVMKHVGSQHLRQMGRIVRKGRGPAADTLPRVLKAVELINSGVSLRKACRQAGTSVESLKSHKGHELITRDLKIGRRQSA